MANINYDFYCGEDKYSDGAIEDYLRYLADNQIDINELDFFEKTYPIVYHMSHLRENIINWYPIEQNQSVLEIGAGCGAITSALCRKAGKVVSVDLSKRRSEINFQRNKNADNLTIYVGNQNDIQFEEKFDYVVLNGVFEYAMSFTEGPDPYRSFLEKTKGFLKDNGKLLIAIENRLGLKYFTGSAEDHTGNYFIGLNNYPDNRTVRTFSKSEWLKLLESCGLKCKFYYPYPDYKFPVEIFTDKSLVKNGYGKSYYNLEENRYGWLSEQSLAKTFAEEGVVAAFANSFFLEISAEDNFANIDYCKLSCDRRKNVRIITSLCSDEKYSWVEKQASNDETIAHIEQLYKNSLFELTDDISNLPGNYEFGKVTFPFIFSGTFSDRIHDLLEKGMVESAKIEIRSLFAEYFGALEKAPFVPNTDFKEVFGPEEIPEMLDGVRGGNIDIIFENLYCTQQGYQIIDPEWVFPFVIPKSFIIWRVIHDFFEKYPEMENRIRENSLLVYLGVDPVHASVFAQWNAHFVYQWLKGNTLEAFARPIYATSVDHMVSLLRAKTMLSCSLYYDCGEGYCEGRKLVAEVPWQDGDFNVIFDLNGIDNLKALRFDPLEGQAVRCNLASEQSHLCAINAWSHESGYDIFMTDDPMYQVSLPTQEEKYLRISGKLFLIPDAEKFERYTELTRIKDAQIQEFRQCYESSAKDCKELTHVRDQLQNSLQQSQSMVQQTQALLEQSQETLQQTQAVLQQSQNAHQQTQVALQLKQEENREIIKALDLSIAERDQKEALLQEIFHSKGWKMLEIIRRVIIRFKRIFTR